MSRNKNVLSVFLIIVLAFILCSCKNNTNEQNASIAEQKNNTTASSVQISQKEKDDADNHVEQSEEPQVDDGMRNEPSDDAKVKNEPSDDAKVKNEPSNGAKAKNELSADVEVKNEPSADGTETENKLPEVTSFDEGNSDNQTQTQDDLEVSQPIQQEQKNELTCSLIVHCDDVLKNIDLLDENKKSVVPSGGIILTLSEAEFKDGESVFDVVYRELKNADIHFEFEKNPMYNSAYIKGIGNLYEFDCGDCSGWLYKVNGTKPNVGCSQYILHNNDKIELYYSCNYLQKE